jgi:hypothetical protein
MVEKLTTIILTKWEKYTIQSVDILLWFFLVVISYSKWIEKIVLAPKELFLYLLSGSLVLLLSWFVCTMIIYLAIKVCLTKLLAGSSTAARFFISNLIPKEYVIPVNNVFYRRVMAPSSIYLEKIFEFLNCNKTNIAEVSKTLGLFSGIVLKFILLILVVIPFYHGIALSLLLISLISAIIILFYLMIALSSISVRKKLTLILSQRGL